MQKVACCMNRPKHAPQTLAIEPYLEQAASWPQEGKHILAHYDDETIVVYQAYKPAIAEHAVKHQQFAGAPDFKFSRMSWIKTNFCWMQYRSGWNTKPNQERTLAVRIKRDAFDSILADAIESRYDDDQPRGTKTMTREEYEKRKRTGDVRLQWDPDYEPTDILKPKKLEKRRAIQLGLRGETLRKYAMDWVVSIEDVTAFVQEMRSKVPHHLTELWTPKERIYTPSFLLQ